MAMTRVNIRLSIQNGKPAIQVSPDPATVKLGSEVQWKISGWGKGDKVIIDFADKAKNYCATVRGPFKRRKGHRNDDRRRGKLKTANRGRSGDELIVAGIADVYPDNAAEQDDWKYDVEWKRRTGPDAELDPHVRIRK